MIQTFTHNDLLRYAYNETNASENLLIEEALLHDPELLNSYLGIIDMQVALSAAKAEPSSRAVQNILSYSANHPRSMLRVN
jgi:hypothetical protein